MYVCSKNQAGGSHCAFFSLYFKECDYREVKSIFEPRFFFLGLPGSLTATKTGKVKLTCTLEKLK